MSSFGDSEAEESLDESLSNKSAEEEEEEDEEEGNVDDIINDDIEESAEETEANDNSHRRKHKRRREDEELDDEDIDLLEENLGVRVQRKKYHRLKKVKPFDSDEEEEGQGALGTEREKIANQLFEDDEGKEDEVQVEPGMPSAEDTYADIVDSESDEDDVDDFIVDDDGQPIKRGKKQKRVYTGVHDSALLEAQDIFGLDFDFDEFDKYGQDGYSDEEDEYEEEVDGEMRSKGKRKSNKKTIYEVFEPSELEKGMLTDKDNEIRITDIPERFQVRDIPVKPTEDGELEEEAEWIYKHAFLDIPISLQQDIHDTDIQVHAPAPKPQSAISKIKEALNLMRNQFFEVPFIASYRKEYIEPELNTEDLWRVWEWDEKWVQLRTRKQNLHRLFEDMQQFQFDKIQENPEEPIDDDTRILQPEDIDRLDAVQTMEQLKDVYSHFILYYGSDIPVMREAKKKRKENEGGGEGERVEAHLKQKMPAKRDLYTICKQAGLNTLARKFGLTPDQFGENLRDNYQRHETEQHPVEPEEAAEACLSSTFSSVADVLEGARHMVAMQIARDPLVRQSVRQTFYLRAKISVKPTKKGRKEIDELHPCSGMKYLQNKPAKDLKGDQFLRLSQAEEEGLLTISIAIDLDKSSGYNTYLSEVKQLYYRDEFSHLVQEWNNQRMSALARAFDEMLYPLFEKELKAKLLEESKNFVIKSAARKLRSWIEVAPFQPEQQHDEAEYETHGGGGSGEGLRVLACSYTTGTIEPAFLAMLDGGGQVVDYLRLRHLLLRWGSTKAKEREAKEEDMETLKKFILKRRPQVVAVAAEGREAQGIVDDFKRSIAELEQENQMGAISVELVDSQPARVFQASSRAQNEFREYPTALRQAVSVGRRLQDPLAEFAGLCVEEDELLCLKFHPLQDLVPKERLVTALHLEFVTVVNEVGLDPNRLLEHPHTVALMQFVCGLGPRKGSQLLKTLRQSCSRLENRSQLVTVAGLGPKVFLNCAGFIKIDTASISETTADTYMEVLDGSRVHPETYEWAKKMAVDALEYDEATEEANPSAALEEILDAPERLKDLDLDAFAEELERQGYGNKRTTLYDIRDELFGRYKERRSPYRSLSVEERFRLLTGETPKTLYVGKMVLSTVTGFAFRKPHREQIDQANPERSEGTGQWQCPFCLQASYPQLSEVWTHLDNGSCAGQTVGVRLRLENGISGFMPTKMISDKKVNSPQERVRLGMALHCRVTRVNMEKFQVDLTSRSSDLADKEGKFSLPKDLYFDQEAAERDMKKEQVAQKKASRPKYIKRVIVHPAFRNVSFKEAEQALAEMDQGECIVRPSSKGADHLTVTWKVSDGIFHHVDVREEGKENAFSLGRSLWIDSEDFEDLDEIIARHIQPMATCARDILNHKNFRAADGGQKAKLEEILVAEKKKTPQRIPYYLSASREYPGKFLLGYMPRVKPRVEFVSITPDGFRYRGRVHATLNVLFRWFKAHFRDPIPGVTPKFRTPVAMSESNTPYTPSATPSQNEVNPSRLLPQIPRGITAALAAVAKQQKSSTPTYSQWNSASGQQQSSYQQLPQYGYYQTHQDQPASGSASLQQGYTNYQQQQQQGQQGQR